MFEYSGVSIVERDRRDVPKRGSSFNPTNELDERDHVVMRHEPLQLLGKSISRHVERGIAFSSVGGHDDIVVAQNQSAILVPSLSRGHAEQTEAAVIQLHPDACSARTGRVHHEQTDSGGSVRI